ncbi:hypothetical protein GCM10010245_87690 [Streptomyces spectabilis]|nr:hypothetical protein GCM10010245_87690 [Streptomyces spectabilis]
MFNALFLLGGTFWIACYLLIIRSTARDRVTGMPLLAVAANISWEFVYSFITPYPTFLHPAIIVWFLLDLVIVWQTLRHAPAQFSRMSKAAVYSSLLLGGLVAVPLTLALGKALNDPWGVYAAYLSNLMMSSLFLAMLYQRGSSQGQSMGIALTKLLGTASVSAAFGIFSPRFHSDPLLITLYLATFAVDSAYVLALLRTRTTEDRKCLPHVPTVGQPLAGSP